MSARNSAKQQELLRREQAGQKRNLENGQVREGGLSVQPELTVDLRASGRDRLSHAITSRGTHPHLA
jgi:hypothetical protein